MKLVYNRPGGSYSYNGVRYIAGLPTEVENVEDAEYLMELEEDMFVTLEQAEQEAPQPVAEETPPNVHINKSAPDADESEVEAEL